MAALLQGFLLLGCTGLLLGCTGLRSMTPPTKPNIVFMVADDLGWSDVSFHGSKQIPTPNIDAIARDGIILNQHYVQPICSPTRGSLMTGKYAMRIGFQHDVIKAFEPWGLPLEEKVLPQYLKSLNYRNHAVGKWHLGFFKEEYLPRKRGFDSFFGYYTGVKDYLTQFADSGNMTGLDLNENEEPTWLYNGTYGADLYTDKAKKIIEEHDQSDPLFLYFCQQAPHSGRFKDPLQAPEHYVKPMVGIEDEKRHIYAGMVSSLDHSVGEIFDALESSGMLDNTIFIFTSDNGAPPREADGVIGSNWPLKGAKYTLWEGGVRVVSFIWSPFLRGGRIHNELMHVTDWLPTILCAAGGPIALEMLPSDIDGVNQWHSLVSGHPSPRREILLNMDFDEGVVAFRRGRYKLMRGSYYQGDYDKWYDYEGRVFNASYSFQTPQQKNIYEKNYASFLRQSKAANVLSEKYGKDPRLTSSCRTPDCKNQLEVQCGFTGAQTTPCNVLEEACLFDVISDPCELHNLANYLPTVLLEMALGTLKYKPLVVPAGGKPADPNADPELHGNAWGPWM